MLVRAALALCLAVAATHGHPPAEVLSRVSHPLGVVNPVEVLNPPESDGLFVPPIEVLNPETERESDSDEKPDLGFLENGCPEDPHKHWLLPHESDCILFYYCVWGEKVLRECAPGTYFNRTIQVCDWPQNVDCAHGGGGGNGGGDGDGNNGGDGDGENGGDGGGNSGGDGDGDNGGDGGGNSGGDGDGNNGGDGGGNSGGDGDGNNGGDGGGNSSGGGGGNNGSDGDSERLDNGCPVDFDTHQLLPHESDCTKFYYCVYGDTVERSCPSGLNFNADIQVCDWPENAGCANGGGSSGPESRETDESSNPSEEIPEEEQLPNGCPSDWNTHQLLPHEEDCTKFYYCVHGNTVERNCPAGLHFNAQIQVCDWPQNVDCANGGGGGNGGGDGDGNSGGDGDGDNGGDGGGNSGGDGDGDNGGDGGGNSGGDGDGDNGGDGGGSSGGDGDGDNGGDGGGNSGGDGDGNGGGGGGDSEQDESGERLENGCPADFEVHQLLPHETDCGKFYYCVDGDTVERGCPPGLLFNPSYQVCDWPENVDCDDGGGNPEPESQEPNVSGSPEEGPGGEVLPNGCPADFDIHHLLPHESDCGRFYNCVHGNKIEMNCPPGLHFNDDLQICDWPANVDCANSGGNPEPESQEPNVSGSPEEGPGGEVLPNGCPSDWNIHHLLPHESDCTKFYYCVHGNTVERNCPPGLHFNPQIQVCDWPGNAGCEKDSDQQTSVEAPASSEQQPSVEAPASSEQQPSEEAPASSEQQPSVEAPASSEQQPSEEAPASSEQQPSVEAPASSEQQPSEEAPASSEQQPSEEGPASSEQQPSDEVPASSEQQPSEEAPASSEQQPSVEAPASSEQQPSVEAPASSEQQPSEEGPASSEQQPSVEAPHSSEQQPSDEVPASSEQQPSVEAPDSSEEWYDNGCPRDWNNDLLMPGESCSTFKQCDNGKLVERDCPDGLHFSVKEDRCEWPDVAGCEIQEPNTSDDPEGSGSSEEAPASSEQQPSVEAPASSEQQPSEEGPASSEQQPSVEAPHSSEQQPSDEVPASSEQQPSVEAPDSSEEWYDNGCPRDWNNDLLMPGESCSTFKQCDNGKLVERDCPDGLHFSVKEDRCEWPEVAGCESQGPNNSDEPEGSGSGEPEISSEEPDVSSQEPDVSSQEPNVSSQEPDVSSQEPDVSSQEPDVSSQEPDVSSQEPDNGGEACSECNSRHRAHETDCDKFWYCDNGVATLGVCSEGLHFNSDTQTCDFICNVHCLRSDHVEATVLHDGVKLFVPWNKVDDRLSFVYDHGQVAV